MIDVNEPKPKITPQEAREGIESGRMLLVESDELVEAVTRWFERVRVAETRACIAAVEAIPCIHRAAKERIADMLRERLR